MFYVNGGLVFSDLAFGNVTEYVPLPEGSYEIVVNAAGSQTTVINVTVPLQDLRSYTIAATDFLATITPRIFVDDNRQVPTDSAAVRFIHLAPDAPNVDVGLVTGENLFADVAPYADAGYIVLPANTYDLEVRLAGTSTGVLVLNNTTIAPGIVITVFAEGSVAGQGAPLQAVIALDATNPVLPPADTPTEASSDDTELALIIALAIVCALFLITVVVAVFFMLKARKSGYEDVA